MAVIDIHTHFIPTFLESDGLKSEGVLGVTLEDGWVVHPEGFRYPLHPEFINMDAKLAAMDAREIDIAVLSSTPTLFFYESPADQAVEYSKRANDALAEMICDEDRLEGFAQLPLQDPLASAEELERCITELGFRGAHIGTNVSGTPIDDPSLRPVLEVADRHRLPLLLHPYYVGSKPGLEDFYLTNTLGNLIDTTVAGSRLLHSEVFGLFPDLPIVLVHAGGFLPFQIGRLDHAYEVRQEPREFISEPPSSNLDRFWMDTITHSDEALEFLASRIGTDRIVLGTDIPFDMGDARPLERVRRAGIDTGTIGATAKELIQL